MRNFIVALMAFALLVGFAAPAATAGNVAPTATYHGSPSSGVLTLTAEPTTRYLVRFAAADGTWPLISSGFINESGSASVGVAAPPGPNGVAEYRVQFFSPDGSWTCVTIKASDDGWLWD
ncbi:MAG: hypothetical protein JNM10_15625 [Planctomycetia bacterium]|nr:hypothetical protein [Planctomycetia bacterium]